MLYSKQEIYFLEQNYPIYGIKHCAKKLCRTKSAIRGKVNKLGLKLLPKVDQSFFINNHTKESVIILGLLFADGHINTFSGHNTIEINSLRDDLKIYYPTFKKTGDWYIYFQNRKGRRPQATIRTSNPELCKFLLSMSYGPYNTKSTNIIKNIPEELHRYFYRGLIDGDGCFYMNRKNGNYQFSLAGAFKQDWRYFTILLDHLKIKYSINRRESKTKQKRSDVRITNKTDVIALGNYIYQGYSEDKMGLPRKYHKFMAIKDTSKVHSRTLPILSID